MMQRGIKIKNLFVTFEKLYIVAKIFWKIITESLVISKRLKLPLRDDRTDTSL